MTNALYRCRSFPIAFAILGIAILLTACAKKGFPEKFAADRAAFDESILAFWEAGNMFQRQADQPMVMRTPRQEEEYFALLEKGVGLGGRVGDEFLEFVHPDLKKMYRENLISGKRLYLDGARKGDRLLQSDGSKRVLEWDKFWEAHQKEIAAKIYPETQHAS